jgi:hypothetical protein
VTIPVRHSFDAPVARGFVGAALVVAVLAATGCVTQPEPPPAPTAAPAEFDRVGRVYHDAADRGESVYRIDRGESVVQILVYRDGALARLGHDHAVTGRQIHGFAWLPTNGAARADLYLVVAELVVDDPDAREAAGFTTEPTAADRAGTYRNMLASLDAERYPYVLLYIALPTTGLTGGREARVTAVDLTLHGTTRRLVVPVSVVTTGAGFRVTGTFRIRQTDFGIKPFSVLGGALAVRDELELHFDLGFGEF